jgi:hypothetical protein
MAFDESQHPRGGEGTQQGGKFVAKGEQGTPVDAPAEKPKFKAFPGKLKSGADVFVRNAGHHKTTGKGYIHASEVSAPKWMEEEKFEGGVEKAMATGSQSPIVGQEPELTHSRASEIAHGGAGLVVSELMRLNKSLRDAQEHVSKLQQDLEQALDAQEAKPAEKSEDEKRKAAMADIQKYRDRRDALLKRAQLISSDAKGAMLRTSDGKMFYVTEGLPQDKSKWRVSHLDKQGQPVGHETSSAQGEKFDTIHKAAYDVLINNKDAQIVNYIDSKNNSVVVKDKPNA